MPIKVDLRVEKRDPAGWSTCLHRALGPGTSLGRSRRATLQLPWESISEYRAFISLRDKQLILFPLRRNAYLEAPDGRLKISPREGLPLAVDQRVLLSEEVRVHVEALHLPEEYLLIEGSQGDALPLGHEPITLYSDGALVLGDRRDGDAWVTWDQQRWSVNRGHRGDLPIEGRTSFKIGQSTFFVRTNLLANYGSEATLTPKTFTRLVPAVAIVQRGRLSHLSYEVRELDADGPPLFQLRRKQARLLYFALRLANGTPCSWAVLSERVDGEPPGSTSKGNLNKLANRVNQHFSKLELPSPLRSDQNGRWHISLDARYRLIE